MMASFTMTLWSEGKYFEIPATNAFILLPSICRYVAHTVTLIIHNIVLIYRCSGPTLFITEFLSILTIRNSEYCRDIPDMVKKTVLCFFRCVFLLRMNLNYC